MIGYTFGAAGILLVFLAVCLIFGNNIFDNNRHSNGPGYGAITLAVIFGVAAVVMFIIGQAWLWEPRG